MQLRRDVGRDLAGVVAGVALLGQRDDERVPVVGRLQAEPVALADDLGADGDDLLALLPQEDKALCQRE